MLTLYAALAAFGNVASFWAIAMAYLIGLIANSLPVPGGFAVVEGGLVGMLDLFHVASGSTVVAAVVVYRAISLWVPALLGSVAFLSLRRDIGGPPLPRSQGGRARAVGLERSPRTLPAACAAVRAWPREHHSRDPAGPAPRGRGSRRGGGGPGGAPGALIGWSCWAAASASRERSEKTSIATRPV